MKWQCLAVTLTLALSAVAAALDKPISLEYRFKKGDIDTYRIVLKSKSCIPELSPRQVELEGDVILVQKVVDVLADGSARIEVSTKDGKITPNISLESRKLKPVTAVLTITKEGRIADTIRSGVSEITPEISLYRFLVQVSSSLLTKSVKTGQTLTQAIPFVLGGSIAVDSTLSSGEGLPQSESTAVKQVMTGKMNLSQVTQEMRRYPMISPALKNGLRRATGNVEVNGSSSSEFSTTLGRLVSADCNLATTVDVRPSREDVEGGLPAKTTLIINTTLQLTRLK